MTGTTLRENCLICGDRLAHGNIYICEVDQGKGNDCYSRLPKNVFNVPQHIDQNQKEEFTARLIIRHKERILNDNSINRRHTR